MNEALVYLVVFVAGLVTGACGLAVLAARGAASEYKRHLARLRDAGGERRRSGRDGN